MFMKYIPNFCGAIMWQKLFFFFLFFFQASVDAIREFLGVYAVAFGSKFDTVHPGQGLSFERIFVPATRTSLFNRSLDVAQVGAGPNVSCGITAKSWAIFAFNISISFS